MSLHAVVFPISDEGDQAFGLIRILGKPGEHKSQVAQVILEHLEKLQAGPGEHVNIPRRFEQILQAMNERIAASVRENPKFAITDFHAVVGVQVKNQLFLSGVGSLTALFMHRTAKQRFVIYELDRQFQEGQTWEKPFLTVLDGELHPGDVFYLATRTAPRDIKISEMQDILVTLPPSGALKRIQQHLSSDTEYGAVCFQISEPETQTRPKKMNPLSSIESLTKTTEETASLLGEQSPEIGSVISRILEPILKRLSAPGTSGAKAIFKRILKLTIQTLAALAKLLFLLAKSLYNLLRILIKATPRLAEGAGVARKKIQSLPKQSKWIGAGALFTVFILVGVLLLTNGTHSRKAEAQSLEAILATVEEKKDAAAASLIYDDIAQAQTHLSEAIALLDSFPSDDGEFSGEVERLRGEINNVLNQIHGQQSVSPALVGDFATQARGQVSAMERLNGVLYAFTNDGRLFELNELEQAWKQKEISQGSIGSPKLSAAEGDTWLIVDGSKQLGKVDLTAGTLSAITSGVPGIESVEDITLYNGNLYALTAAGKQVVKMRPQVGSYDGGTVWITSANTDLSSARALSIDGSVYILTATGVAKFTTGKEDAFALEAIEPALIDAQDLWTSAESDYLYLLEPSTKRIVVYKKTGEFVTQYTSDSFAAALTILADESKNLIYVATESGIESFAANHLLQ